MRELTHINDWDRDAKEELRKALVQAILENRSVQFFWELYDGSKSDTEVHIPAGTADIIVTFRNPRSNVRWLAGQVRVSVQP